MNFRTTIVASCVCAAAGLLAQGTISLVPPNSASSVTAMSGSGERVKVLRRGVGTTKTEALKDAYRDAIESAVGLYVDAEQMMKNSDLVKDQILTQSNAYIEKFDITDESTGVNGLVTVKILATVKKSALTQKLSDVMPPQSFKVGSDAQNIHAASVTKEIRNEDAAALLKKTLDGVNPITQLVRLSLADTKMMAREISDGGNSTKTCYFYRFKFELDEKKYYEEFLPPLLKVLEQISVSQPKTVMLQKCSSDEHDLKTARESYREYITGEWDKYEINNTEGLSHHAIVHRSYSSEGAYEDIIELGTAGKSWFLSCNTGNGYQLSASPYGGGAGSFEIPGEDYGKKRKMNKGSSSGSNRRMS